MALPDVPWLAAVRGGVAALRWEPCGTPGRAVTGETRARRTGPRRIRGGSRQRRDKNSRSGSVRAVHGFAVGSPTHGDQLQPQRLDHRENFLDIAVVIDIARDHGLGGYLGDGHSGKGVTGPFGEFAGDAELVASPLHGCLLGLIVQRWRVVPCRVTTVVDWRWGAPILTR